MKWLPYCNGVLQHRFSQPSLIELIWSYWHEEGMLVQTMNAIAWRFQNQRSGPADPLADLEMDPLRPLNNLIWGYVQDEQNRLTVRRRAYEYDHQYGLQLLGKAFPTAARRQPVELPGGVPQPAHGPRVLQRTRTPRSSRTPSRCSTRSRTSTCSWPRARTTSSATCPGPRAWRC